MIVKLYSVTHECTNVTNVENVDKKDGLSHDEYLLFLTRFSHIKITSHRTHTVPGLAKTS